MASPTELRGVPLQRVRLLTDRPPRPGGEFVLYWMIAQRRLVWNFALDRAIAWAQELGKPLVVLEALRCDYRWASDRIHRFVLEGMAENARRASGKRLLYVPYVEPEVGAGKGLLRALSRRACTIVTDDFPCFFLPRMVEAAARQVECRLEAVDGNGLFPLSATDSASPTAYAFRRILQKKLPGHLATMPAAAPLEALALPVLERLLVKEEDRSWEPASEELLSGAAGELAALPIDHSIPAGALRGGSAAAETHLASFLYQKLLLYAENRNQPDEDGASGLSPLLALWTHLRASGAPRPGRGREVVAGRCRAERDRGARRLVADVAVGGGLPRSGSDLARGRLPLLPPSPRLRPIRVAAAVGARDPGEARLGPARAALRARGSRCGGHLRSALERCPAATRLRRADAQLPANALGKEGARMVGDSQEGLAGLIELNNRYALDGRNPNSYSGIFWCFGRFDRPWGPERPIFGTVRYMSSANTARKLHLKGYLARHGVQASLPGSL